MEIRNAKPEDGKQLAEIYNHYILNTPQTFETEALSAEEMASRIAGIAEGFPFLVAEEEELILGYAYADRFRLRKAFEYACEVSVYVRNDTKQRGVGTRIYEKLFIDLQETDVHTIFASISMPNDGSVKFHEKLGFKKVGNFEQVGYKLGRWVDVGFWQKLNILE